MEDLTKLVVNLVRDPYDPHLNFELGYSYEMLGHFAAGFSFYLRCAEFSRENVLSCEALLRASYCLNKQGSRDVKELYLIQHALSACPTDVEPHYVYSLYHSWREKWLPAYTQVCIALSFDNNVFLKGKRCYNKAALLIQKAKCGTKIGKIDEARQIYVDLLQNYQAERDFILSLYNALPQSAHPPVLYDSSFKALRKPLQIKRNYSQIYQDIFVITMCDEKKGGTYLEIGSGKWCRGNNTWLLEKEYGWHGISIDIDPQSVSVFNSRRENECICADAKTVDYMDLLRDMPFDIDYLQLDCDPPQVTFDILLKIPFDRYRFGVITYEHDFYNDITGSFREKSRQFLISKGYVLVAGNISPYTDKYPFEDWWVHPGVVDKTIYAAFLRENDSPIFGEDYMLIKN